MTFAKSFVAVLGLSIAVLATAAPASAQYERGYGRNYDRGYEQRGYDQRGYDRGYNRDESGYDRGYDRGERRGYDRGYDGRGPGRADGTGRRDGMPPGWNRMTVDQQKQAIKNQREAQKKALKRGYVVP